MKHVSISCIALVAALLGCDSSSSSGEPNSTSMASFDVAGTWSGTATDDDTNIDVKVLFTNNGGASGMQLAGELELEGIGTFPFADSFISPLAGAARVADMTASDDEGFTYTLRGNFSNKRLDDGQLTSTNPKVGADTVFLKTVLVKDE